MGWFQKKQPQEPGAETEKPSPARNPDNVFMFRMVAVAYVLYTVWKTIKLYLAGGEDAPRLWMLCLSTVLLGGGAIVLAVISFRSWKKIKLQQQEEAEAEAEAELEALEEASEEDEEEA